MGMNVFEVYDGDKDNKLAWLQHDCYYSSLSIMRSHALTSAEEPTKSLLAATGSIDHRTLQNGHDDLAAAFRHHFKTCSGYTITNQDSFFGQHHTNSRQKTDFELIDEWQNWLENWLKDKTEIGEAIARVVLNQNNEEGYAAERELRHLIRLEFSQIGWIDPTQFCEKKSPQSDELTSEENQQEHLEKSTTHISVKFLKLTQILLGGTFTIAWSLVSLAVFGAAIYFASIYYIEHYILAAFGVSVGIAIGCIKHEIWVERILFGLLYGLCVLLVIVTIVWVSDSGTYDPDCFTPSRYC